MRTCYAQADTHTSTHARLFRGTARAQTQRPVKRYPPSGVCLLRRPAHALSVDGVAPPFAHRVRHNAELCRPCGTHCVFCLSSATVAVDLCVVIVCIYTQRSCTSASYFRANQQRRLRLSGSIMFVRACVCVCLLDGVTESTAL